MLVQEVDGHNLTEYLPNQIGGMASAISPFFYFQIQDSTSCSSITESCHNGLRFLFRAIGINVEFNISVNNLLSSE